jgi:hypothetical protein
MPEQEIKQEDGVIAGEAAHGSDNGQEIKEVENA